MSILEEEYDEQWLALLKHCLTTSYFQWGDEFYEQTDCVAMGSPFVFVANLSMKKFKEQALNAASHKPTVWYSYVDDAFVIWPNGKELERFLEYPSSILRNIHFTVEVGNNGKLAFLDVLVKRPDDTLEHYVYSKKTDTNRFLQSHSHHHPFQKMCPHKNFMS